MQTAEEMNQQLSADLEKVGHLINGEIVVEEGEYLGGLPGEVLRAAPR